MKKAILFAAALFLIAACCKDDNNETEPEKKKFDRTVLVYVAGDNNLTGSTNYFAYDLRQMMLGTKELSANNKLILFVDNYKEKPFFLQVENGDTTLLKTMGEELKTSDPEVLYEAMKYVTDNFEAESYGLVLWGHADGWILRNKNSNQTAKAPRKSYGVDNKGGRTFMDIPDMAKVLARLPKLKYIFADCCCFLCVEDVYELRNCADYIIGSAAEIPAEGAPYGTVVPALFSQDSTFYKQIVEKYYEQKSGGYDTPLAVVKTSELENLAQATSITLKSFASSIEPDNDGCRYPYVDGLIFYYDHTQFDMQDFMLRYASADQYAEWKRVFDRAVPVRTYSYVWMANHVLYNGKVFKDFSPTMEREGGLGMFVPQRTSDAALWSFPYLTNLEVSVAYLNSSIKRMQWYDAAHLADLGW